MRADERRVFYFDLVVKRLGKSSQVAPLGDLVAVWEEQWRADKAHHSRARGTALYMLSDLRVDREKNIITLLVSVIDKNLPDAAYGNLDTRKTKIFKKGDRDGGHLSAHVVISLTPQKANTYLCLVESVRHLSAANIQYLLNSLLRIEHKNNENRFTMPHPGGGKTRSGAPRRVPYLPLISLGGHPSPELIADLENGIIRNLVFVQSREEATFADDPYLEEEAYQLTVGVKKDIPREKRWDRLKAAIVKIRTIIRRAV